MTAKDDLIVFGVLGVGLLGGVYLLMGKMPNVGKWFGNVADEAAQGLGDINEEVKGGVENWKENVGDVIDETVKDVADTMENTVIDIVNNLKAIPKTLDVMQYARDKEYDVGPSDTIHKVIASSGNIMGQVSDDLKKAVDIGVIYDKIESVADKAPQAIASVPTKVRDVLKINFRADR